jgi:hypothetical protein
MNIVIDILAVIGLGAVGLLVFAGASILHDPQDFFR